VLDSFTFLPFTPFSFIIFAQKRKLKHENYLFFNEVISDLSIEYLLYTKKNGKLSKAIIWKNDLRQ